MCIFTAPMSPYQKGNYMLKIGPLMKRSTINRRKSNGCSIRVNGDLGRQSQPVYIRNNNYVVPTGNSGVINLNTEDQILVACTGSGRIQHPNILYPVQTATATCVRNNLVSGNEWLNGTGQFSELTCSAPNVPDAVATNNRCFNNNFVIRVGYIVNNVFYPLYWSCFDQNRLEVLYVWYEQNPENAVYQHGVDRPSWLAGSFFTGVDINNMYTKVQQKATIARLVGQELADKYVTSHQFLTRGHLAAKTDFIYATGQSSSFYFINAAPQWQPFNAGNWNWLEQNLRKRIGQAGYNTIVYTGTFCVTQLRDQNNCLVDIFLHTDANNNPQVPVPLYFYKVAYDPALRLGTAFISINNPYYTEAEVRVLTFCTDRCRNNDAFKWLEWQPDRIELGYSFCCTVADFRNVIPHLPNFDVIGLLT
ncbi:uncharacterized protein LOC131854846 isoform X1 [Achroia grisella]|uniref:uncharacterized protein LOC131854846 isoform X1 n=1 Tax=Achroia grisella TaxID=688607 RepID=UPI0027D2DE76|nr:uncharacterized protein LOC131854846 isoform X1 [Achroia grisella]